MHFTNLEIVKTILNKLLKSYDLFLLLKDYE